MSTATLPQSLVTREPLGQPGEWLEPLPIPDELLPVEPFAFELLPESLRGWVSDIAERMQCPPDFVAVAAMATISGAIGRRACIEPKRRDDWRVYATVWAAAVGPPGAMKSPPLAEALKPLRRLEAEAAQEHAEALADYEIAATAAALTAKAAEKEAAKLAKGGDRAAVEAALRGAKAEEPEPPRQRRYTVTNSTVEALAELLRANPTGLLVARDELTGLLKSMEREGHEEARAFYLQGYDGASGYTFDRIGRGFNLHVPAVWLSLVGSIQPGPLRAYVHAATRGGGGDDGLLQRFGCMVWPDPSPTWRNVDRYPDTDAKARAFETVRALSEFGSGAVDDAGVPEVHVLKFDGAGQEVFDGWRARLEAELRADTLPAPIESHLAKYRKLMPTMALLCALADGEAELVRERHALQGAAWCDYLRTHAERVYHAGMAAPVEGAKLLLKRIREGKLPDPFTAREVQRKGWMHLGEREDVQAALDMLADLHHLHPVEKLPPAGRPSVLYRVNPRTLEARHG
jgi:putative DNA primase/helicase